MLTISKPLNSEQALTYHAKEFTSAEQNYWKQGDTIVGEWHGKLAEKYGLSGAVDAEKFARLSEGHHPHTGDQLVRHRTGQQYTNEDGKTVKPVEHRAGWDATFSAPKSVSLTALVGGDDRVREAHRDAVNTALSELERYTQARIGGNHAAETTGRFVAAKFEHDTARPVDGYAAPQLHTHAVVFNLTERGDGTTRALQERGLFASQQFATAVYQAQLTYRLRELGYVIEPGRSGAPEIKGYTQEYLDASSPRRQQILEAVERSGFKGHEAAQIAAHSTRDRKEILSPDAVLAAHRQLAADHGNQAERIIGEARERAYGQTQIHTPETDQLRAQEAISYARDRSYEREAVTDERDVFRDALRRGMGETTYGQVRAAFNGRVEMGEFQQVASSKHASADQYTTLDTIRAEMAVVRTMRDGQNRVEPIMSEEQAAVRAASREFLNPSQRAVIEEVLTSRDRIQGLQGTAGSGKTSTLETIREGAERSGYAVEGFAPTGRAAAQLREAGIFADTLQGYLASGGRTQVDGDPGRRHLFMVDESSLPSTKQMREFLERIGPQDRVLLIGDTRQHQGVEAGKPFEQLQHAGMRTAQLDQIVRQKDPELLRAVEHLAKNETKAGIDILQKQGRVTELADPQHRIEAIAKSYAVRPENTLIVSPDNASRQAINQAVRVELQEKGTVAKNERTFLILTPRSEMTGADRAWAQKYQSQDVLHYSRGSKEHAIERGGYSTVVAINPTENLLTVQREDGQLSTYDPKRLKGITAYREREREFAPGDRIQFTAPDRNLHVANRELAAIQKIDGSQLTVKMDGEKERVVTFDANRMRHIDHGYAVTSHSSQGLTADRVLINMDTSTHADLINTRFAYVSVSRASHDVQIYTNDAAALGQRLSSDVTKTSAVDFQQRQEPHHAQQPKEPIMSDQRQERRQQPEELFQRQRGPIEKALTPQEGQDFTWKRSYGEIQTYEHDRTHGRVHIDPQGQFYDRHAQPITREAALDHALGQHHHHAHHGNGNDLGSSVSKGREQDHGKGISL
jgi:conjugative relaxase-like TrwC/TraI family protein